jgi:NADH-quinone oxidoreductase subunit J
MFNNLLKIISIALITSTAFVVVSNHVIISLFFLVLTFVLSSFILILFECEFLGLMFVIVYVGAIAVLFLFLVMMVDIKYKNLSKNLIVYVSSGFIIILLFLLVVFEKIGSNFVVLNRKYYEEDFFIDWFEWLDSISDVETYSMVLYSDYVIHLLLTGLVLLVVLVGISYYMNTYLNKKLKKQSTLKQISISSKFFAT